jgi:hypothetical protein
MVPPARELIEELVDKDFTPDVEDVYERDEKTGVLIRVGKTRATTVTRRVPTGRMVERFTTGKGKDAVVHEGSMKQVDLFCHDCGSELRPANDRFYYLLCSRLNDRNPKHFERIEQRPDEVDGRPVIKTVLIQWDVESDEPYKDCVLECGREGLD